MSWFFVICIIIVIIAVNSHPYIDDSHTKETDDLTKSTTTSEVVHKIKSHQFENTKRSHAQKNDAHAPVPPHISSTQKPVSIPHGNRTASKVNSPISFALTQDFYRSRTDVFLTIDEYAKKLGISAARLNLHLIIHGYLVHKNDVYELTPMGGQYAHYIYDANDQKVTVWGWHKSSEIFCKLLKT